MLTWWEGVSLFFSVIAVAMLVATLVTWWLVRTGRL